MALVRLPSLLFVGASTLQMGSLVCGYQLMVGDSDGMGDVVLGAVGFAVAVVLLPVIPMLLSGTIISRRRYKIEFPPMKLSFPSIRPKPVAEEIHPQEDDDDDLQPPPTTDSPLPPTSIQQKMAFMFLPESTLDTDFHPMSVAFSTFVSRNRLPHAIWSTLPYLTPLALLPALVAPIAACLPLLITSALLHIFLAAVMLVFRPHSILFSNLTGAAALMANATLVICAAALTHDPGMELARAVLNGIGGVQMMISVVRLVHVGIVSAILPLMMTSHMLPRPVRVAPIPLSTEPLKAPSASDVDNAVALDEEMVDIVLDDDLGETMAVSEVDAMWSVVTPCAPRWPPVWAQELNGDDAADILGIGNNFIQDLLFAPDMNGPRPESPEKGVSDHDDDDNRENIAFVPEPMLPSQSSSSSSLSLLSSSLELEDKESERRIKQLQDPTINPMALMDSTAHVVAMRSKRKKKKRAARHRHGDGEDADDRGSRRRPSLYYFADTSSSSSSTTLLDDDGQPLPRRGRRNSHWSASR